MASAIEISSRHPSICIKPSPNASSTASAESPSAMSPSTPSSLTTKEWIIPPRPKPGRKPATDTPPTKRKAQNRAAQRAFRERRAARVGELEEQMKKIEEEDEAEQQILRDQIERLGKEVERYQTEMSRWIARCKELEKDLAIERAEKEELLNRGQMLLTDAVPLPARQSSRRTPQAVSASNDQEPLEVPLGCGNCSSATRCQCIDEAFNMQIITDDIQTPANPKRPHSPMKPHSQKRIKAEPQDDLETDFTSAFSSQAYRSMSKPNVASSASVIVDPCGFCQDGTPCMCAEMAAVNEEDGSAAIAGRAIHSHATPCGSTIAPVISQLSQFTPPPSEGDVSSSHSLTQDLNTCASGPGTCAQCRADPNSTLFCKSLAASRSIFTSVNTTNLSRCCGGSSSSGSGCCMAQSQQPQNTVTTTRLGNRRATRSKTATAVTTSSTSVSNSTAPTPSNITLTCADTYTTLSRHQGYQRASGEIASWMPKLCANNVKPTAATDLEGRPAMEIDAANVMSVLREFDRRFGENC